MCCMQEIVSALKKHSICEVFDEVELEELAKLFKIKKYKAKDFLIQENSLNNEVFFLEKGTVEILKTKNNQTFVLRTFQEKEILGEMTFIDSKQRCTAGIQAKDNVEVLSMEKKALDKLPSKFSFLKYKFPLEVIKAATEKMDNTNQKLVEEIIFQKYFAKFVLLLILCFCWVTLVVGFHEKLRQDVPFSVIATVTSVIGTGFCIFLIKLLQQPIQFYGVTLNNWKQSLFEGILICSGLIILYNIFFPEENFISTQWSYILYGGGTLYIIVAFLQEFVFRGILQSVLQKFYEDEKGYFSVLVSSLVFSIIHVNYGYLLTILSFLMGLFLGMIYLRHKNLLGVSLIHLCLGCMYTSPIF